MSALAGEHVANDAQPFAAPDALQRASPASALGVRSRMRTYEASAVISAEASAVWHVLSDVAHWPHWLPTVTKVTPLDGTAMVPGSRFIVYQPKLRPATWQITQLEAPHRFVWEARSPGLRMVAEHAVAPQASGSSAVLLRFSFGGLLGGIIGSLFRSITERYLAQEAAALKDTVERSRDHRA